MDCINKTVRNKTTDSRALLLTSDSFGDKAIEGMAGDDHVYIVARYVDLNNFYYDRIYTATTTQDHNPCRHPL